MRFPSEAAAAAFPRTILIIGVLAASASAFVRAAEPRADPLAAKETVAVTVGESPIFHSELEATVRRAAEGRALDPEARLRLTAAAVEQLVDERLLKREVDVQEVPVDEDGVTEVINRLRGQLAQRKIPIDKFLAQSGRDESSLRSQIRLEAALNSLLAPRLTSDALAAAFAKHKRDIDGTLIRASHIVLRPDPGRGADALADLEGQAARLRTEILQGAISFAEAARKYSAGPSRRQGGDIGFFPRHGVLDEEFVHQAFALAKGEMSKPFTTSFGVHLLLVTDVKPGDARPETLRPQLEKLVVQDAIREIVTRGRQTTPIEYAPGVPHFATDADRDSPGRRVVVEDRPTTSP